MPVSIVKSSFPRVCWVCRLNLGFALHAPEAIHETQIVADSRKHASPGNLNDVTSMVFAQSATLDSETV